MCMSPAEIRDIANSVFSHFLWAMPSSWQNCTTTLTPKWGQTDGVGADGLHQQFPFPICLSHTCLSHSVISCVCICLTKLHSEKGSGVISVTQLPLTTQHYALYVEQMSCQNKVWREMQKIEPYTSETNIILSVNCNWKKKN